MPVTELVVQGHARVIVPIGFKRANTGNTLIDAPEVDDRGFEMGNRGTLTATPARGPMFGVTVGTTVRLAVTRNGIADAAPLFVTSSNPAALKIVAPAEGVAIPADGIFSVEALLENGTPHPVIQIRFGSKTGPVVGETEPHLFRKLTVAVTPHFVRIDSATATGTRPALPLARIMDRVRAIWRPCGVDFDVKASVDDNTILPAGVLDTLDMPAGFGDTPRVLALQRARLGLPPGTNDNSINWYVVPRIRGRNNAGGFSFTTVGLGISRDTANTIASDTGIIVTADGVTTDAEIERVARTTAHEIGHFFRLRHVQSRNADNPVKDSWGRRQLMFPLSFLPPAAAGGAPPRTNDVGYGNLIRGCLITLKDHAQHSTDGETLTARKAIQSGTWM